MSLIPAQLGAALVEATRHPLALLESHAAPLQSVITSLAQGQAVTETQLLAAVGGADTLRRSTGILELSQGRGGRDIAVLHLHGIALYNFEFPGLAYSTRMLAHTIKQLAADSSLGGIILDISSPGGVVTGIEEAADAIYAARQVKSIVAVVNPMAASAAYWIASQASTLAIVPSGDVGSIGVFYLHLSLAESMKMAGVEPTYIFAGERKIDANFLEPLSDRARDHLQGEVDTTYALFTEHVARGRGVSVSTARGPLFGEGNTVMAREAVRVGLADRLATVEEEIGRMASAAGGAKSSPRRATKKAAGRRLSETNEQKRARLNRRLALERKI